MNSLPFTIRGVYTQLVDLEGLARVDGTELVLEFRTSALRGIIKSQPKELRVSVSDLEEVTFKRVFLSGALELRARRMGTFASIPGSVGSELRLRCKRAYWGAAQELASHLGLRLVEQQLRTMIDQTGRPTEPPPPPK
jgi:hypothetical protein